MSKKRVLRSLESLSSRLDREHTRIVQLQIRIDDCIAAIEISDIEADKSAAINRLRALSWNVCGMADVLMEAVYQIDQSFDDLE